MSFDFATIGEVRLSSGGHKRPEDGLCVMEMVAWFAGERHTDRPKCCCPELAREAIQLNDGLPDDLRDRLLKPLVPLLAGTRGTKSEQLERITFLARWKRHVFMPFVIRRSERFGLAPLASALRTQRPTARQCQLLVSWGVDLDPRPGQTGLPGAFLGTLDLGPDDLATSAAARVAIAGLRRAIALGPHEGFAPSADLPARRAALAGLVAA